MIRMGERLRRTLVAENVGVQPLGCCGLGGLEFSVEQPKG